MNKKDKARVAKAALQMAWLWSEKAKERSVEVFKDAGAKQSLRDALTCMKVNRLIEDFWILPPRVQVSGVVLTMDSRGQLQEYVGETT